MYMLLTTVTQEKRANDNRHSCDNSLQTLARKILVQLPCSELTSLTPAALPGPLLLQGPFP